MRKLGFALAAAVLAAGLASLPATAQTLNWDGGPDLLGQINARREASASTVAPAPKPAARLLVVDAVDAVMGNFHRYDNARHRYGAGNFWADFIGRGYGPGSAFARQDTDGTVTIEFSDLEDLLKTLVQVSREERAQVAVLNINAHGRPGGNWFPPDEEAMNEDECQSWMQTAEAPDAVSYRMYYSEVSKGYTMSLRRSSTRAEPQPFGCVTGAGSWRRVAARIKGLGSVFAPGAQVHFDSCLTGLGKAGETFVEAVAEVLFPKGGGNVLAAMDYGLTDWSMPKGMGFWDYQNDAQLSRFNRLYPRDRKDSEFAQTGGVRVARYQNGAWTTFTVAGLSAMPAGAEALLPSGPVSEPSTGDLSYNSSVPQSAFPKRYSHE
ncbi:MAG: hypothetical protein KGL04_04560 [Elusimicrobia bacterium]|nr:hypothetical protein [Elusimicrobiota bacterium]